MNICVYGAASDKIPEYFKTACENLGEKIAKRGHTLVFGGGAGGVMGATARGAYKAKGEIIGISPTFFDVDGTLFGNCSEMIRPETMRIRKQLLEERSDVLVMAPGGVGTFDEFFEILTLKQLGRHNKAIAVYNVEHYFDPLFNMMDKAIEQNFINEDCVELYKVFDNEDEMLDYLENYKPENIDPNKFRRF